VLLLTALLILASLQSSFAAEWVKYDDGESNVRKSTTTGRQLLVKFSLPLYYQEYRIVAVSFYVYDLTPFRAHVFKPGVSCTDLFVSDITPAPTSGAHWIEVTMPPEIVVTGYGSDLDAFFVSIEYLTNNRPEIGFDTDRWNLYVNWNPDYFEFRSYEARPSRDWNCAYEATMLPGDLMIRALVEESSGPTFKKEVATTTAAQTASVQPSGAGLGFAVIAIGAGAAAAAGGLAVALSQPRSEAYAFAGYYYCRKHRTIVWSVEGRLWCPVERRFLKP
jgi:hypothetical protein